MMQNKNRRRTGDMGEAFAADILEKEGYSILCKNYTCKGGEIDIVAAKEQYICFIEVKLRSSESGEIASVAVDEKKTARISTATEHFLDEYRENLYISSLVPRTDIFEIYTAGGVITKHIHTTGIS